MDHIFIFICFSSLLSISHLNPLNLSIASLNLWTKLFGWKKTKTKLMAWRKTTTVKRRSCGEGGAEAEVEARQTRLGQALCWLHLLTTITDLRSSSDETGKRSSGVTESVSG
ncbi:hypothetical protein Bca4012_070927 [Brassica carinata]